MTEEKKLQMAEPAAHDRGNAQERDGWWQAMRQAIQLRDELHGAQRHAAFEAALRARELDQGVDYFQAQGRVDLACMERRAA